MVEVYVWTVVVWDESAEEPYVQVFGSQDEAADARAKLIADEHVPESVWVQAQAIQYVPVQVRPLAPWDCF